VQGSTINPWTGELWTVEHGAKGGDEINTPKAGKDYGWPTITYGEDYSGKPIGDGITQHAGMEQPIYYWDPVIAPSGWRSTTPTCSRPGRAACSSAGSRATWCG
jgi:glucose/arabinose dehydrogenase